MRVAVAMSGGIDSSVTAIILKEAGYEVVGITARMIDTAKDSKIYRKENEELVEKSIKDARKIADKFGFEHRVIDLESDFEKLVVAPFCKEYLAGRTPSPCIRCNASIKFKSLVDFAHSLDCEKMATGHYARIINSGDRYAVQAAVDPKKDQSYFLFMLSQDVLKKLLFPLGDYSKEEIRELARNRGLEIAEKPDSQEICFIPDDNYKAFIETYTGTTPEPGDIVNSSGKVLGKHKGIYYYTIGQRRGMGISAEHPLYVIDINVADNQIVVGFKDELEKKGLIASELYFMNASDLNIEEGYVKTRSTQKPVKAKIKQSGEKIEIIFEESVQGISPGQAAVIYNREKVVLGGGWIESSF